MVFSPPLASAGSDTDPRLGVMICGHGSRNRQAVSEFAQLAEGLRLRLPELPVEYGYLEFARPILRDGLERLRQQGVNQVLAVPGMLFAAGHAKNDIPSVLNTYAAETGLRIDYGRELGIDLKMIQAAAARIREALARTAAKEANLHDAVLVVVGRGSSDPDANSNVSKVTRMLVEGMGFGWGETLYSGVTFPLVEPGLRHVVRLGFRRVVVFPYFLFSGVLVSRIRQHTERVAADHPALEFIEASYLGDHPLVIDTFRERVAEVVRGDTQMNCSLCKYRAQVLGFETEVGAPQQSHHHHVEGLIEGCTLCERECTGACQPDGIPIPLGHQAHDHSHDHSQSHDHGPAHSHGPGHSHSHAPYPQADHPLGPRTLTTGGAAVSPAAESQETSDR
ncbi:sirohydrochlorin chelatase [Synechococcus sp. CS-1325]|uniref:CbiX/SirB N-terminal domain-containing protein n=1 Tax=unclassified Synechococcus TaxID=2626047 RepID=UPI000DB1BFA2|nr:MULTISPECIES: CbiX/SirB N-terminal domain-containing protein [unclassified Synechococcus]MCT0199046.1 sirohydrochlorin chelatase [Synechococcus sp. CS-1325]MCT0212514.1 sirohydrochlorin chelatase [Synechococcus sp. CS-1326]MCT0232031.1 sirohydrochlorin chelatase [Synechococcus sp. CS-1327]PZU99484.1 MAG: sirohydrochlorin chelatase [Cyanobium sp.]